MKKTKPEMQLFKSLNLSKSEIYSNIIREFEYVMITVIILNSILLSLIDYSDRDSLMPYN